LVSLPRERAEVISDGRVTIPKRFRDELEIKEGSILEAYVVNKKLVFEVLMR